MFKRCLSATALAALGLTSIAYADGGLDDIRQTGVLRVAVYKDNLPYSYQDNGRYVGLDVDLAQALAKQLGVNLSLMPITASDESMDDDLRNAVWKGHYLGGGVADVMLHVPVDPRFAKRNDKVSIFAPYYQERLAIAYRYTQIPDLSSLDQFRDHKLGVELEGSADRYMLTTRNGELRNNIVHFRDISAACNAFKQQQIPALLFTQAQIEYCVRELGDSVGVIPFPESNATLFSWPIGLAVKTYAPELQQALEAAFAQLQTQGELKDIFTKYNLSYLAPTTPSS